MSTKQPDPGPLHEDMWIDGTWCRAAGDQRFAVFNPATGEPIANVSRGGSEDVDRAVRAARAALGKADWRGLTPYQRERLLHRLADLVEADGERLAALESLNQGKLLKWSRAIEVGGGVQWLRYMAGWATRIQGSTFDLSVPAPAGVRFRGTTLREPVGVVGAIVPWNFPLAMAIWKIAPALACGCTVVLKPAEETPLTALRLAHLAREAGIPDGVLNVVTGDGATGAALVRHPDVDKITFTGSTEVGREIGAQCGRDIRRVALELGGKSPVVIMEDMDVNAAVEAAAGAIFFNHGQVCTAGSRLYVARSLYQPVVEGLAALAEGLSLGAGLDDSADMGPMVSAGHRDRVRELIDTGREEGGEVLAGGERYDGKGYYVRPTVVANPHNKPLTLVEKEVFGPVVVAMPFEDLDQAIDQANDSIYGLGASIWTRRLDYAQRAVEGFRAGTVWVNAHNLVDPAMPFGGVKSSGIGREHGEAAIEAYTELKSVCMGF
ncbi:aldehyde dehydrogenase family protein [Alloalcanivorax profundimaris]|uniref:aldehyde dehydrogenase family protein n=1 Tax=Alloalcanivorax profundimaris TaxID=2735259 RepID=UPI0018875E64|nr:aldehyde dehydrogenase family protein [Alloalcanivorax profundimaris]MBF1800932.1 aldehyde dehydrogenase [Alloalcanivorax profundimaris]MCQ6261836.1 aldehyde dehydrogenase family protein [Alcanivorax sp. MM125-6]